MGGARAGRSTGMLLAAAIIVAACGGDSESNDPSGSADPDAVTTSPVADSGVLVIEDEPYREPAGESGGGSTVDIYVGDGNEDGPAVVLLHGSCHTPTGVDLEPAQWQHLPPHRRDLFGRLAFRRRHNLVLDRGQLLGRILWLPGVENGGKYDSNEPET